MQMIPMLETAASIADAVNKANLLMVETGNWFLKNKLILNSIKSNIMLLKKNLGRPNVLIFYVKTHIILFT